MIHRNFLIDISFHCLHLDTMPSLLLINISLFLKLHMIFSSLQILHDLTRLWLSSFYVLIIWSCILSVGFWVPRYISKFCIIFYFLHRNDLRWFLYFLLSSVSPMSKQTFGICWLFPLNFKHLLLTDIFHLLGSQFNSDN